METKGIANMNKIKTFLTKPRIVKGYIYYLIHFVAIIIGLLIFIGIVLFINLLYESNSL